MKHRRRKQPERSCWVEMCCLGYWCLQHFWPRIVMRKWLNITTTESDFSADTDEGDSDFDSETEELYGGGGDPRFGDKKAEEIRLESWVASEILPRIRRQKSETLRAQYINTKELRICVGTWNVGAKLPPDDLDIDDWLDVNVPADVYVIGLQEIVPLNAGNIFGAEDGRPVPKWEYIIRDTLNRVQPTKTKFKCYSDPPSPSKFKPSDDIPDIQEEILHETDSEANEEVNPWDKTENIGNGEVHPLYEDNNHFSEVKDRPVTVDNDFILNDTSKFTENANLGSLKHKCLERQYSLPKRADRLNMENSEASLIGQQKRKLTKTLSQSQRIGWSWPELPSDLLAQHVLERRNSLKSLKESKSFKTYSSFKSVINGESKGLDVALLTEIDLEYIIHRKRRSPYVRIISKQMVGIFLSIWVRRSLRKHIQNLKVSTVGVGAMGYIGNKGSISVSMSIYQTLFCFICTHLTSGEKYGDELRRNADVREIHRRTQFHSASEIGFPKTIRNHERIIWFGDLNYRINLSYEETRELILRKQWSKLVQKDQLVRELENGRAFDGWKEGTLNFPPTYKYEFNSEKYHGEDPKAGRRTPAWCDRVLSFGKGLRLLNYKRSEQILSDHRPVTAIYMAEVEVLCHRKLQKALSFTDLELEEAVAIPEMQINAGMSNSR